MYIYKKIGGGVGSDCDSKYTFVLINLLEGGWEEKEGGRVVKLYSEIC